MADKKQSREVKPITHTLDGKFVGCGNEACLCTDVCFGKATKVEPLGYTGGDNEVRIAEEVGKPSDVSIKITADVGEALTGFKALQRELRETTKAAREMEQAYKDVEKVVNAIKPDSIDIATKESEGKIHDLSEVSTQELSEELAKREGVEEYRIKPHGSYAKLSIDNETHGFTEFIEGPARILVNKD